MLDKLEYENATDIKQSLFNLQIIYFNDTFIRDVLRSRFRSEITEKQKDNLIKRHIKIVYGLPYKFYEKNKRTLRKGV